MCCTALQGLAILTIYVDYLLFSAENEQPSVHVCSALCCSVFQHGAVLCSVLQGVVCRQQIYYFLQLSTEQAAKRRYLRCRVLSVLQCVAACCSMLQRVECVAACCSVLQRVAARRSALQRVAACCMALRCR